MSQVFLNINYEGWFAELAAGTKGLSREGQRLMLTESNRKTVAYWHRVIIPKHFEANARSRYHYQKRKAPYRKIKQRLAANEEVVVGGRIVPPEDIIKQGVVDVVRSGKTEKKAESPVAIFATPNRAVATLRVPRFIVQRPQKGRPDQKKEIQSITKAEKGRMIAIWKKTFLAAARVYGKSLFRVRRSFVTRSAA